MKPINKFLSRLGIFLFTVGLAGIFVSKFWLEGGSFFFIIVTLIGGALFFGNEYKD